MLAPPSPRTSTHSAQQQPRVAKSSCSMKHSDPRRSFMPHAPSCYMMYRKLYRSHSLVRRPDRDLRHLCDQHNVLHRDGVPPRDLHLCDDVQNGGCDGQGRAAVPRLDLGTCRAYVGYIVYRYLRCIAQGDLDLESTTTGNIPRAALLNVREGGHWRATRHGMDHPSSSRVPACRVQFRLQRTMQDTATNRDLNQIAEHRRAV